MVSFSKGTMPGLIIGRPLLCSEKSLLSWLVSSFLHFLRKCKYLLSLWSLLFLWRSKLKCLLITLTLWTKWKCTLWLWQVSLYIQDSSMLQGPTTHICKMMRSLGCSWFFWRAQTFYSSFSGELRWSTRSWRWSTKWTNQLYFNA